MSYHRYHKKNYRKHYKKEHKGIIGVLAGNSYTWQRRTYFIVVLGVGVCLSLWLLSYLDFKYVIVSLVALVTMTIWIKVRKYLFHKPLALNMKKTEVHYFSHKKH